MQIIIASVLKTVEDVRLYHKIAQSLSVRFPDSTVAVWGQSTASKKGLFNFSRLGWARMIANFTFFKALWCAKPSVVIVATFELLPAAVLYKWLSGGKLGYDVQENYVYNVLYTRVFPQPVRLLLAFTIRCIERLAYPFIDFCWVAEACYLTEMPFLHKKSTFLPNKVLHSVVPELPIPEKTIKLQCLYSGNVSSDYGIWEAIDWVARLQSTLPAITLKVIGHCPRESDRIKLEIKAAQCSFLTLEISQKPIAHHKIITAMRQADWLLMPYKVNKSVAGRIPTKFYEGLALGKKMLITKHTVWQSFMADYPQAINVWIDFKTPIDTYKQEIVAYNDAETNCETKAVFWNFSVIHTSF